MATLRERVQSWRRTSYAVEMRNGLVVFFEGNRYHIRRGRLVFLSGLWRQEGAVEKGEWIRVQAGVTPYDLGVEQ